MLPFSTSAFAKKQEAASATNLTPSWPPFLFLDHRVLLQPFFIQFLFLAGFSELWTKKILRWRHRRYQTLAPIFYSECFGLNYIYSYIGKHPQLSVKLTVAVQYSELQWYVDFCSLPYNCKTSSYNIASFLEVPCLILLLGHSSTFWKCTSRPVFAFNRTFGSRTFRGIGQFLSSISQMHDQKMLAASFWVGESADVLLTSATMRLHQTSTNR